MDLFIPTRINNKYKGIGKKELIQIAVSALICALIALFIAIVLGKSVRVILLFVFLTLLFSGGISFFVFQKNNYNMSFFDQAKAMIKHMKTQKFYPYIKSKEWK
ncbi:MAG: hypothetical protein K0R90_1426 [Oscillospiraceae bacterium]|jgi:uncharacterized protein involved in cysteine biosynthesis|nr:hypothetical protein [Oscillospiraceae bacterium]